MVLSPAATPTKKEPSCSVNTIPATLPGSTTESTIPKFTPSFAVATSVIESANKNPTPMIRSLPCSANNPRSSALFSPPSLGSKSTPSTPNSSIALSKPAYAMSLNERSPRPPMSYTIPILAVGPAVVVGAAVVAGDSNSSAGSSATSTTSSAVSDPPQATITRPSTIKSISHFDFIRVTSYSLFN